jgi:hypothetical protein
MSKAFKSTRAANPQDVLSVARGLDPTLPPAAVSLRPELRPELPIPAEAEELVQLNIRVGRRLADWLADKAIEEGISQKVWVCRALQASGAPVAPSDLQDRVVRRRRGTLSASQ